MTTDIQRPAGSGHSPAPLVRRIYGFGGVFAKTLRDSRRATIAVGAILGILLIAVSKTIVTEFATVESRQEIGDLVRSVPPIMQGLAGKPVNVETLGGYVQYKYGTFFPLVASLWSILALSGTLASEARRGSLEFVAASPLGRRRIALEKLFGHIVVLTIAMVLIFLAVAVAGTFGTLPGDEIPITAAAGYAIWLGLMALVAGAVAFAIAPFLGRGAAAGIAGALVFGGFILNGYQNAIPGLAPFANLTWFGWTTNHLPLAGQFDWPSVVLVAVVAVALLVVGVAAFVRRDIGDTSAIPLPSLPQALVGLSGPAARAAGQNLTSSLAWGLGLGFFGLLIAGSGRSFVEELGDSPEFARILGTIFPGIDIATVGGFLQLLFIEFGLILAGLAAATLVANWASDETSGRLELLLATPLARARWVASGAIGVFAGIVLIVALAAVGIAVGASITGGDIVGPVIGTLVLGLYAIALAGIGFAIGGVIGTGAAGPAVAILTIVIWFDDIIAPALGLPAVVQDLALTAHYGQPMLGVWDPVGIVASLALAFGGVAIGAWGFTRRDLRS
jgi:polyether ionophore transport system permease protein